MPAIRTYFEQLRRHETVVSRWAKLVLVGDGEVGKTSLLRLLQWRRAAPTDASERTVQLDLTVLGVGEANPSEGLGAGAAAALFSCWDLSGQPEYAPAQQPFLTAGPLFMLAVPAHRANDRNYSAVLGRWLDVLQVGAPGALVQPLITQADRLLTDEQKEAAVTRRVFRTTASCAAGLPSALKLGRGRYFYEVTIESMGTACSIGWATPDFEASIVSTWAPSAVHLGRAGGSQSEAGDSWVLNCVSGQLRRSAREFRTAYQESKPELCEYRAGDVIGVAIDLEQGLICERARQRQSALLSFSLPPASLPSDPSSTLLSPTPRNLLPPPHPTSSLLPRPLSPQTLRVTTCGSAGSKETTSKVHYAMASSPPSRASAARSPLTWALHPLCTARLMRATTSPSRHRCQLATVSSCAARSRPST